jgi:CRP-like cAMP-binding protein
LVSVIAQKPNRQSIEVACYGHEGIGGLPTLLGDKRAIHAHVIQIGGTAFRIAADAFLQAVRKSPQLKDLLLCYSQVLQLQLERNAFTNGAFTLHERLARHLCMCHDRVNGEEVPLTHHALAAMLGMRRSGVTLALQIFEGHQLLRAKRGRIIIRNRAKLEEIAGVSYGVAEAAYERLIGPFRHYTSVSIKADLQRRREQESRAASYLILPEAGL